MKAEYTSRCTENRLLKRRGAWLVLPLLFLLALGVFQPALAKGVILQGDVPAGKVVDNDLFLVGESPSIDGTVHGDVFVIGNRVAINGEVNGSLIVLGEAVQINSQLQGTVSGASLEMTLGPEAALHRNLYFIGLSLVTRPGSSIGRDLVAWCFGARLDGRVERNMRTVIGPLELINAALGSIHAPQIRLSEDNDTSALPAWRLSGASGLLGWAGWQAVQAAFGPVDARSESAGLQAVQQAGGIDWTEARYWLSERFEDLVVLFAFGLLAAWLFPRRLIRTRRALERKPLSALGYGLLGLVLAINLLGVVLLLTIILLFVGLWVGSLDLWPLALAFWAVAYPALALAAALFGVLVIFGTKIIVSYFVGDWLLQKLAPKAAHRVLAILVGLLIYVASISIPMIGWVIAVLVTTFGIGAAWMELRSRNEVEEDKAAETANLTANDPQVDRIDLESIHDEPLEELASE